MFREVRRRDRALSEEDGWKILTAGDYGVLATLGADGYPYAIPVNYTVDGNAVFIHCGRGGHKLENLAHEARVSFTVTTLAEVVPHEFKTRYLSVVAFGRAQLVQDPEEKRTALYALLRRFSPDHFAEGQRRMDLAFPVLNVIRIDVERLTGKGTERLSLTPPSPLPCR